LDDDRPVEVRNFNAIQIASKNTHPYWVWSQLFTPEASQVSCKQILLSTNEFFR
jgi:hypothetical protein